MINKFKNLLKYFILTLSITPFNVFASPYSLNQAKYILKKEEQSNLAAQKACLQYNERVHRSRGSLSSSSKVVNPHSSYVAHIKSVSNGFLAESEKVEKVGVFQLGVLESRK